MAEVEMVEVEELEELKWQKLPRSMEIYYNATLASNSIPICWYPAFATNNFQLNLHLRKTSQPTQNPRITTICVLPFVMRSTRQDISFHSFTIANLFPSRGSAQRRRPRARPLPRHGST